MRGYQSGGMPGNVIAWELIPLGGGRGEGRIGGDTATTCLVRSFAIFSVCTSMDNTKVTIYHLISQAGWTRCNLSIYLLMRVEWQQGPASFSQSKLFVLRSITTRLPRYIQQRIQYIAGRYVPNWGDGPRSQSILSQVRCGIEIFLSLVVALLFVTYSCSGY